MFVITEKKSRKPRAKIGTVSGLRLYTAEQYLRMPEYKITGKLKRELDRIEKEYEEQQEKNRKKWGKKK